MDYSKYTVKVLKDLLRDRGLPVSGRRKADYVERLAADDVRLQQEAPAVAEDEEDEDLDDEEEEDDDDDDEDEPMDEEEELDRLALEESSAALGAGDEGAGATVTVHGPSRRLFPGRRRRWMTSNDNRLSRHGIRAPFWHTFSSSPNP